MTGAEVQILVIQPVAARAIAGILLQSPVIRSKSAKTCPPRIKPWDSIVMTSRAA